MRRFLTRQLNNLSGTSSNDSSPQFVGNSPRNVFAEEEANGEQFYETPFEFWNPEFASDPVQWESAFKSEWEELKKAMQRPVKSLKDVSQVCKHLEAMCKLLVMEINSLPVASIGPLLELVFAHDIYHLVIKWAKKIPVFLIPTCQVMLLGIYERLVARNYSQTHCLLVHKPILLPLLELLQWCQANFKERSFQKSSINKHLVLLLHQICMKISDDTRLLDFFFNPRCSDDNDEFRDQKPFLVFNLLVNYIFGYEDISYQARDAILLILTASRKLDFVARHVAHVSDFCPVLSSGLSACFSELPGYVCEALRVREDEFHKIYINRSMDAVPEICNFHSALLFCNAVVQIAHVEISRHIVKYFYDGFLLQVVDPLLEMDADKFLSRIAYFHLCIEIITEPAMIQAILKMLTAAETNVPDMNLLEVILDKMNSSDRLCRAVLSLLRTLLELRSEDFLWVSLFRYILPFVKLRPQRLRFDVHVCLDAANAFLACIPACVLEVQELVSESTFNVYNVEAYELLRSTSKNTRQWTFQYDGLTPNNLLNLSIPEETLSARQPFTRLSSARSSMASNAWNRYFQSRSAHTTNDSIFVPDSGRLPLNQLGEDDILINLSDEEQQALALDNGSSNESAADEPLNYELMTQSNTDYFQFAYDGISESDESSRHNSCKDEEEEETEKKPEFIGMPLAPAKQQFLSEIRAVDWMDANESLETLVGTLDQIKYDQKTIDGTTADESISLINARYQHLIELKSELESLETERKSDTNPLKLDLNINGSASKTKTNGLLMTCTMEKGSGYLFEALVTALEMMVEHNFTTNVQLASVLEMLASYSQPIIASVVLYSDALNGNALPRLTRVLEKLKLQIDAFSSSVDNFDELIRRGARNHRSSTRVDQQPKRSFTPRGPTTFRHLQLSARERTASDAGADSARTKNFAYAAIVLSQIAQQLAAFAIQQCPTYSIN